MDPTTRAAIERNDAHWVRRVRQERARTKRRVLSGLSADFENLGILLARDTPPMRMIRDLVDRMARDVRVKLTTDE